MLLSRLCGTQPVQAWGLATHAKCAGNAALAPGSNTTPQRQASLIIQLKPALKCPASQLLCLSALFITGQCQGLSLVTTCASGNKSTALPASRSHGKSHSRKCTGQIGLHLNGKMLPGICSLAGARDREFSWRSEIGEALRTDVFLGLPFAFRVKNQKQHCWASNGSRSSSPRTPPRQQDTRLQFLSCSPRVSAHGHPKGPDVWLAGPGLPGTRHLFM